MTYTYTVAQLAQLVGGDVHGDGSVTITGIADLREASSSDASWLTSAKFRKHLTTSSAGVVLLPASMDASVPCAIVCQSIHPSVAKLLAAFAPRLVGNVAGVHPSAVIHSTATLGDGVVVGPHVTIDASATIGDRTELQAGVNVGENVAIGSDCCLQQNVVVRHGCRLGDRVTILPNSVIGGDGFGFFYDGRAHQRIPHVGGVIIEDDVEIGACSCIDRAKFGHTTIGAGTKIDNLVQLAHNVRVGRNCVIVAQTGIAGSVRIGDGCVFAGRSGASDNITIGDGAQIAATSVPWADVAPGAKMAGTPAQDSTQEHRMLIHMRRLPALAAKLKKLIARVDKVEASAHNQQ